MGANSVLANHLDLERNSFNLVRLVAALLVLVSHSFSLLSGLVETEPLASATPFTLGQHAVNAFFVISGLTLAQSLERNPDLIQYAWSRFLRIVPGLFVFGLIFAFVAGPLLTSLRWVDYFGDAHTWLYPAAILVQFARAVPPHEIFANLPFSEAANNPLWTIKYEIVAYVGLAVFFRLGLMRRPVALFAALALSFVLFMSFPASHDPAGSSWPYQLGRYGFCFLLGMIAFHYRHRLSLSADLLMFPTAMLLICLGTFAEEAAYVALTAHLTLLAGARSYGALTRFTQRSDLSYGTYIYGWPVQQSLILLFPAIGVPGLMFLSLAIVPLFAVASWKLVERPALHLKKTHPRELLPRFRYAC